MLRLSSTAEELAKDGSDVSPLFRRHPKVSGKGCDVCLGAGESYMVRNETWQKALLSPENYACIACLEQRLGRRLTLADFPRLEINNPTYGTKSPELLKRLKDWRVFPKNAIPQDGPNITESQYKAFIKKHPEYDL